VTPATYSTNVPAANLFPGTFWGMNPNLKQPYLEQWNFGIQRGLGHSSALEVRYVGNLGLHQWLADNLNEVNIFENGFLPELQHGRPTSPAFPACATKGNFAATGQYPINFWQVNPFASGRNVNYLDSAGMSNYHGLQVEFRQRPTHGAQFNVNYTWSHSLGISAQNGIQGQGNNIYYTLRQRNLRSAVRQGTTIPQLWLGRQRRVRRLGRWARFW